MSPSLLGVFIGLASLSTASLVGAVTVWGVLRRRDMLPRSPLVHMVIGAIFAVLVVTFIVTFVVFAEELIRSIVPTPIPVASPTPSPPPIPTPPPTPAPFPQCQYVLGEWPCIDEVRESTPRDSLCAMAKRNYQIEGDVIPLFCSHICDANREIIEQRYYANVPKDDRDIWGYEPCNYLVPGERLVIPVPPPLPLPRSTP